MIYRKIESIEQSEPDENMGEMAVELAGLGLDDEQVGAILDWLYYGVEDG